MKSSIEQALQETFFQNKENDFRHTTHDTEMIQYAYLKNGDKRAITECRKMFQNAAEGQLSKENLRSWKYMFVSSATLCCRFAMDGGLASETSSHIFDRYIQRMDIATTKEEIFAIHDEMVEAYFERIVALNNANAYARPVLRAIDYVDRHLHCAIRLNDIAEEADVSPNYLSALFSKEMKMTISQYIRKRKIQAAESLLQYTDYKITEIAEYFDFSSVSHFIKVFKEETGTTPALYKQTMFRHWKD